MKTKILPWISMVLLLLLTLVLSRNGFAYLLYHDRSHGAPWNNLHPEIVILRSQDLDDEFVDGLTQGLELFKKNGSNFWFTWRVVDSFGQPHGSVANNRNEIFVYREGERPQGYTGTGGFAAAARRRVGGHLAECDIYIQKERRPHIAEEWTTSTHVGDDLYGYGGNDSSIQAMILHELGHCAGLDHEGRVYNLMGNSSQFFVDGLQVTPFIGSDTNKGLVFLYGRNTTYRDIGVTHWKCKPDPQSAEGHCLSHPDNTGGESGNYTENDRTRIYNLDNTPVTRIRGTQDYQVEFTYDNISGAGETATVHALFFLSADVPTSPLGFDEDEDIYLGYTIFDLSDSAPLTRKDRVHIPEGIACGSYYLGVMVQEWGWNPDHFTQDVNNDANNVSWHKIIVPYLNAPPSPQFDLYHSEVGTDQMVVRWISGGGDVRHYLISKHAGQVFGLTCDDGEVVNGQEKTYTNLTPYTRYTLALCAVNHYGERSDPVTALYWTHALPPPPPRNLFANVASTRRVDLQWQSGGGSTTGFIVQRSLGTDPPSQCTGGVSSSRPEISLTDLQENTNYAVRVCAVNVEGALSPGITQTFRTTLTGQSPSVPVMPENFSHDLSQAYYTDLFVTWNDVAGETYYNLYINGTFHAPVVPANRVSERVLNLLPATTYFFELEACNIRGCSARAFTWGTTLAGNMPPPPQGFAQTGGSATSIVLHWRNMGLNDSHQLYQGNQLVAQMGYAVDTYTVYGLTPEQTYSFGLESCYLGGCSPRLTLLAFTTPPAPLNFRATTIAPNQITVAWDDVQGEVTYQFSKNGRLAGTLAENATSFTFTNLQAETTYTLGIKSWNRAGYSNEKQLTVRTASLPPASPTDFRAGLVSSTQLVLQWESGGGSTSYYLVKRAEASDTVHTCEGGISTAQTTLQLVKLKPDTSYLFYLCAKNAEHQSSESIPRSFRTLPVRSSSR